MLYIWYRIFKTNNSRYLGQIVKFVIGLLVYFVYKLLKDGAPQNAFIQINVQNLFSLSIDIRYFAHIYDG